MKHNYLNNTPVEEARDKYISYLSEKGFAAGTEEISAALSVGRRLSSAVYAKICSPHYNASAMDGIAVSSGITFGAAEQNPLTLKPDEYTVVDTGDAMPEGTDAVIMVENTDEDENGNVTVTAAVHPWQNVRQVGEDICMGDMLAPSSTVITPALAGSFLAGGVKNVPVRKKPLFGIIPTGDEIVSPCENPGKGEIIEFNSTVFSGMLSKWDAECLVYDIVPDKKELLEQSLMKAVGECDAVLMLAGSSAGRDDYTGEIISSNGTVLFHGIAAKPGKPAILGEINGKPVIGLPGYPVSGVVVMNEIVSPVVDLWYARPSGVSETVDAVVGKRIVSSLKYTEYVRVTLGKTSQGITAMPLPRGAGAIAGFTKANGILVIPQNCEGAEEGETAAVRLLCSMQDVENTLIVTGSHDPVIDEINDIMRSEYSPMGICSTHVGSMGAITAIKSGRAHLGAVHLLDEETGVYNKSYIDRYFPNGGATLIKGIGRVQGIMVKAGNPLGIKEFPDVTKGVYVNRQRGAGTRVLCDYLMKKHGIAVQELKGYENEEFTHTAVAALIANGNADAGLGIYSAAKMYGLDFIPVCNEEYDFLVDDNYLDSPLVKAFFEILHSDVFRARAEKMGGYSFE